MSSFIYLLTQCNS